MGSRPDTLVPVETPTRTLHRLTSYEPGREWDEAIDDPRVVQDLEVNDLDRFPWFTKRYEDAAPPRLALPRELRATGVPALSVLARNIAVPRATLDLDGLSRLLHLSAGVVRTMERPYATWLFRAAGSAGGRFPLELYVTVPDGGTLPPGVHWYDPVGHALVLVGPAPTGGDAPAIVVTGVPWRTGWRYRERGFRHVYWDAGTMLSQLLVVATAGGGTAALYTDFPDAAVSALVGADGRHEWPVAVVSLGDGVPALEPTGGAATGRVDEDPLEFPLMTAAQHAGDRDSLGMPWTVGEPVDVPTGVHLDPIETVVLSRGSQRRMDRSRGLSSDVFVVGMSVAMRGIDLPHAVAVHDVDGFEPGICRWPALDVPVRSGTFRDELYRVALEQDLASDAAFVVIGCADVATLDDRAYREANLAAGIVEGRLHLAAYAMGASASGMTFLDSEIPTLIGEPLDGLLLTCVGVPEYRSTPGGPPGAPVEVGQVTPRTS